MDVDVALREIDEATHKHVGTEGYDRQRAAYEATLEEVAALADEEAVAETTRWVCGYVREEGERPAIGRVERRAADVVRERGGDVPESSRLAVA